ncbi:Venom serine protease 34 [Papilio xuthus]|uniref:Venom serine protease 34 n=1 Tax=Papilio xuthus TaxID=66420 RepID=A0A194Q5T1_PAPXU|nr:Venom serine protease 34 [Papilio xuthus]
MKLLPKFLLFKYNTTVRKENPTLYRAVTSVSVRAVRLARANEQVPLDEPLLISGWLLPSVENMILITLCVLLAVINYGYAQNPNCDFTQNVQANRMYYVYSPGYPRNYTPGVQCRWIGICPAGYNCRLDCPEVNLPQSNMCSMDRLLISRTGDPQLSSAEYYCGRGTLSSNMCSMDRLLISRTGDPQLSSAEYYCGRGTLSVTSVAQRLSIGLISSYYSTGGRFYCQLTAQRAAVTPAPCRCGYKKSNRIVGGQETGVNEFPMMAGVVYVDIRQIKCGGVIISARHVLTAAHCVIRRTVNDIAVVVGEHDVNTGDSPATQGFRVISIRIHPLYNLSNYDNDIAILTLQQDIVFSDRVGPVCLPFKFINNDFAGDKVTVLGWGTLFPGGPTSNVLQKVDLDVISQATCRRSEALLTPRQMCTYTPGKDSCQDDSGGPLLYTDPSNGLLYNVGLVSYGAFCASGSPAVNTRVTSFLDWIVATTQMALYCKTGLKRGWAVTSAW